MTQCLQQLTGFAASVDGTMAAVSGNAMHSLLHVSQTTHELPTGARGRRLQVQQLGSARAQLGSRSICLPALQRSRAQPYISTRSSSVSSGSSLGACSGSSSCTEERVTARSMNET